VRAEVYELNTNWESALKTYKLIAKLDPWNAENYLRIANAYAVLGQKQAAINSLDKILTFAGNTEIGIQALEGKKRLLTQ
jgi:tetratricopeptide (TPR) repeat protein